MHELVLDNVKFNSLSNPFDVYKNKYKNIQLPKIKKNKLSYLFDKNKNENKGLDYDFQSIFTAHSSRFHLNKVGSVGNLLDKNNIKENILSNSGQTSKKTNYNESNFRKKIAFHYRYMNLNNIGNKKNISEKELFFKEKDKKLKKILKYSKLIPKNLLKRKENQVINIEDSNLIDDKKIIINNSENKKQINKDDNKIDKKIDKLQIKIGNNTIRHKIKIIRNNKHEYIELNELLK